MFTTQEQFEASSLYKRYGTMRVDGVLEDGYVAYTTIEAENGVLVRIENTVAISIQINAGGLITMFKVTGSEQNMTEIQKNRIFEFACDHVYGNGRSNNRGYYEKFRKQFVDKIDTGQVQNTFLLAGFNVGFLVNQQGGFLGLECSTTQAEAWEPVIIEAQ